MDSTKIVAVICLTAICIAALLKGIDSVLASAISASIGAIAGYSAKKLKKKKSTTSTSENGWMKELI
ncbi:MAG: hypothetical protein QXT64_00150 [Desulfurococcaceae archaeon]|uniref:Uncharacterized protein n=1 Tax=Ligamenvirales sp. TaxID=2832923 RepID=A0AAU6PXA2_9VIRU